MELESHEVQELFCTAWYRWPTQGLCMYKNKTYYYSNVDPDRTYLYPINLDSVIEVESNYKHLCGLLSGKHINPRFIPTLNLLKLCLRSHENPTVRISDENTLREKTIIWWAKNNKNRLMNDFTNAKPVAIWRRDRPVQQV